jgi:phosphopantetheinyl transferase
MILEADFDFMDERGQVFARLLGFQLRSYGDEYVSRLLMPQTAETYFSEPFMQEETGLICRRVGAGTARLLEDGGGIWKRVLAHLVLNDSELARWHELPAKGRRRLEWLAGRVAAKDAVRQWAARSLGLAPHHASIEIASDEAGRPLVRCRELESRGAAPHVSISHAGGDAVAAADACRVGVDIEHLDARTSTDWARAAFHELDLAGARGDAETLLNLWCAKEAAAKARGTGLRGDPRAWRIEDYSPRSRRVRVAYGGAAAEVTLLREGGAVIAVCRQPEAERPGAGGRDASAAAPPPAPPEPTGVDA